jgi:chorismate mutase
MKSKDVVGRKIVKVIQKRRSDGRGNMITDVAGFKLDNGRVIYLAVVETDVFEYYIEGGITGKKE